MRFTVYYFDHTVARMFVEKTDENGEKHIVLSSPYNFVVRDEIVARIVNADSPEEAGQSVDSGYSYYNIVPYKSIKPGDGIYFDQFSNCYRASEYGFVIYDALKEKIRLLPCLQVSRDKITAYFVVFPTKLMKLPEYGDIETQLQRNNIITILDSKVIEERLKSIDASRPKVTRIEVAKGKEAVNGYEEYFIPLISIDRKAGRMLHDGRIDFREVGSIVEVVKEQEILRRIPPEKPVDGFNVYGEQIAAVMEKREGYQKGDNIVRSLHDENIFLSSIDGCLNVENKKISVLPYAIIKGNVDYESGNIDFRGSILVKGSVLSGFTVKAGGNVVVEKSVDDAFVETGGDLTIKMGVVGKGSTKIVCGGKLKTTYILNSSVEAMGEIEVEDSIINSRVFSNDRVVVTASHGKIMGGEVTARYEVVANVIGNPQESGTAITVGKSLVVEREMAEIRKQMNIIRENVDETIRKIKTSFGEDLFKNPKEFVSRLPSVKKKNCLILLKELSDSNKNLKELSEKYKQTEEKNKLERQPSVIVTETVYGGTIINISKRRRLIEQKLTNVKFYEDPDEKLIKYVSAV